VIDDVTGQRREKSRSDVELPDLTGVCRARIALALVLGSVALSRA